MLPPCPLPETRWPAADFEARLRAVGTERYHDKHPFNLRMHAGRLSREELQTLGAQPLLLPDAHPGEGLGDPRQVARARVPPRMGAAPPRPRRPRARRRRPRALAAAGRGGRPRARRGREPRAGAARRAARLRRLRRARRARGPAHGGGRLAHRTLRRRHHEDAPRRLREALPVGRRERASRTSARAPRRRRATRASDSPSSSSTRRRARTRSAASQPSSASARSCGASSMRSRSRIANRAWRPR